jgi:hypothetical protein
MAHFHHRHIMKLDFTILSTRSEKHNLFEKLIALSLLLIEQHEDLQMTMNSKTSLSIEFVFFRMCTCN